MDILSTFKPENQRSLVVFLLPGMLSFWPYSVMIHDFIHLQLSINESSLILTSLLYLILSLGLGFFIDDLSSRIELNIMEKKVAKYWEISHSSFLETWSKYLTISEIKDREPIMLRYYRTVLMRFKFELNISIAIVLMLVGQVILRLYTHLPFNICDSIIYTVCLLSIVTYLTFEAYNGAILLHELRVKLLRHFRIFVKLDNE